MLCSCSIGSCNNLDDTQSVCHRSLKPSVLWRESGTEEFLQAVTQHTRVVKLRQIHYSSNSTDHNVSISLNVSDVCTAPRLETSAV